MTVRLMEGDCMMHLGSLHYGSVKLVLTDIPYGEVNRESGGLRSLNKGDADHETFPLDHFVNELVRVCDGSFYVFCGVEQVSPLVQMFSAHGLTTRAGVWEKTNPSPMNGEYLWLSALENIVFARKARATFNEHCKPLLFRYPSGSSKRHPTEKPVELFQRIIAASTNRGDTVLDPCAGSGTTGVAALRLGRNAILIERKPEYCALIRSRVSDDSPLFGNPLEAA